MQEEGRYGRQGMRQAASNPGSNIPPSAAPPSRQFGERPGWIASLSIRTAWRFEDTRDQILALLAREREAGGVFNLAPVAIGAGVLTYFVSPGEPVFGVVVSSAILLLLVGWRRERRGTGFVMIMACCFFLVGMTAAQVRTQIVAGPVIGTGMTGQITGRIIWRDRNSRGNPRYLVRPVSIEGLAGNALPHRIRLTATARHEPLVPGEIISGLARIGPYSGPLVPKGYDFGFSNWFEGLGGTGYFMGAPMRETVLSVSRFRLLEEAEIGVSLVRLAIASRIMAGLGGMQGAIAVALITGDRTAMTASVKESLRHSGLAHILAISGLHMALVTLTVFWSLRFTLALFPTLALHYPIRKWATAGGFAAATAYLILSGASVATQRAWIMLGIMSLATFLDRRAVTIRNVVLAVSVILLLAPESLLQPGFQMSFAAAAALVAAYTGLNQWRADRLAGRDVAARGFLSARTALAYASGLAFTSLVAGIATAPFSAWHFHRVAPLGLIANLLAMPIVTVLVMPLALLTSLLMPYGLESVALVPLGKAIGVVTSISDRVNSLSPWTGATGLLPVGFLMQAAVGLILLTVLKTRLRWLALLPLVSLPLQTTPLPPPDLIIGQAGRAIAARDGDGRLFLPYPSRARFVTDIWRAAWPQEKESEGAGLLTRCDNDLCLIVNSDGVKIAIVYAPKLISAACDFADIIAAPKLRWINCRRNKPAIILKRDDFERRGTHLVYLTPIDTTSSMPSTRLVRTEAGGRFAAEVSTTMDVDDRPWNRARLGDSGSG